MGTIKRESFYFVLTTALYIKFKKLPIRYLGPLGNVERVSIVKIIIPIKLVQLFSLQLERH